MSLKRQRKPGRQSSALWELETKRIPTAFRVADIYQTSVCPLARVIRSECRKRKIKHLKVSVQKIFIPLSQVKHCWVTLVKSIIHDN